MSDKFGWTIERGDSSPSSPTYWSGPDAWSQDHMDAVRFARKQDAERVACRIRGGYHRVCEHGWLHSGPMTDKARRVSAGPYTDDQIKHMVSRFLGWRLPEPWRPDNGVSYQRPNYAHEPTDHDWPTGTNLFDAQQAEAMVRYMLEGLPDWLSHE